MAKATKVPPVTLSVIIHQTAAALRFGADGYFVTFAGTEADAGEAAKLILLKNTRLRLTIEVDETQNTQEPERRWPHE